MSFVYLGKFIPKYCILFIVMVNGIVSLISLSVFSLLAHTSILAWRIPWSEEPGGLLSRVSQRVRQDWVTNIFTSHFKQQSKLVYLLGYRKLSCYMKKRKFWTTSLCCLLRTFIVIFYLLSHVPTLQPHGNEAHQASYLLEFVQTPVSWVGDAIQPSHPLSLTFPPASVKVFSNDSSFCIQWPKYLNISISPSNIHSGWFL